jgi:hypothetical protein
MFESDLDQLLFVIGPIAKSIKCLEASHSTVADVYMFWLAIMASLEDLIKNDKLDLPLEVIKQIWRLWNWRFDKMINAAPSDIFVTGFFLVPRASSSVWFYMLNLIINKGFRDADILKNVNPLAIQPVTIHRANWDHPATASTSVSDKTQTLKQIGTALMTMLKAEYEEKKQPIRSVPAAHAATQLRAQIGMYAERKWPFDRPHNESTTPMAWWRNLSEHPDAQILAVTSFLLRFFIFYLWFLQHLAIKLFAMTPNSMLDERTTSTITWQNSPYRTSEKSDLSDHRLLQNSCYNMFMAPLSLTENLWSFCDASSIIGGNISTSCNMLW